MEGVMTDTQEPEDEAAEEEPAEVKARRDRSDRQSKKQFDRPGVEKRGDV